VLKSRSRDRGHARPVDVRWRGWALASALALVGSLPVAVAFGGSKVEINGPSASSGADTDAVLYGIGLSTDPYGRSRPSGFGVATGLLQGNLRRAEVHARDLGGFPGPSWLDASRLLIPRRIPPFRPGVVFRLRAGRLERLGPAPLRRLELKAIWSPDAKLFATEPIRIIDCGKGAKPGLSCWRDSGVVYVAGADGLGRREVARGYLGGWTPDGRLLLTDKRGEEYLALDLSSGRRTAIIPRAAVARAAQVRRAGVGLPVWSADRRYVAALAGVAWPMRRGITATIVVARADGRVIRLITSRYIISMIAWSPRGDRLAWTTSGFPNPHELFVLDEPTKKPRKLFGTSNRHFDWITWSPDGRSLLLDDANSGFHPDRPARHPPGVWRLFDAQGGGTLRTFPRLGGRPLWCCPTNSYATLNG
jgi:hypothetical protein